MSVILAIDGYRRFRGEKRTRSDERSRLKRQIAADQFHNLAQQGFQLEASLMREAWERAREQANELRLALSEASGSWSEFIMGADADKIQAAGSQLLVLQTTLHAMVAAPTPEQVVEMRQQCATTYTLLGETAGKLRYFEQVGEPISLFRQFLARFGRGRGSNIK